MAGPHTHLENLGHENPAPNITSRRPQDHGPSNRDSAADAGTQTTGTRTSTRRGITGGPAVEALLTPPILALIFSLTAIVLVFFFSSRQNILGPLSCSSDSPSRLSIPTSTSLPQISSDAAQANTMSATEQTFIAIKPDGVQRGLIGPIISRFENRGFKLVAMKLVSPDEKHLRKHYADLDTEKNAKWFIPMINYMKDQPMCAMVWEGRDAVKTGRAILGATDPLASAPGTIRGDYALDKGRNICHGSDSVENAQKEIALWFEKSQLLSWKHSQAHYFMEL